MTADRYKIRTMYYTDENGNYKEYHGSIASFERMRLGVPAGHVGRWPRRPSGVTPQDLQLFRMNYSLTRPQLAALLGTTDRTIYNWETGKYNPPVDIAEKMARAQSELEKIKSAQSAKNSLEREERS